MAVYDCPGPVSYHINDELKAHWDKNSIKNMQKNNQDRVYIVDGMERTGKSWWAIQQFAYLDPAALSSPEKFVSRICFTADEFFDAVRTVRNGVIVFDEAFRGFSSRASLSRTNKKLVQALMEMGQNNNIVFIVLPSFFLLDMYPAMLRSHGLFHIQIEKRTQRRVWYGYNRGDKNTIFTLGAKKGWTYKKKTHFKGYYFNKFPGGEEYEKAYLAKKRKSLIEMDTKDEKESKFSKRSKIFAGWLYLLAKEKNPELTQGQMMKDINEITNGICPGGAGYLTECMLLITENEWKTPFLEAMLYKHT